ncbi:hypothetical protein Dimus_020193 [Dionaea muscipula]
MMDGVLERRLLADGRPDVAPVGHGVVTSCSGSEREREGLRGAESRRAVTLPSSDAVTGVTLAVVRPPPFLVDRHRSANCNDLGIHLPTLLRALAIIIIKHCRR